MHDNPVGQWINIIFNEEILVSKIVYKHWPKAFVWGASNDWISATSKKRISSRQKFKDISLEFSDATRSGITLPLTEDDITIVPNYPKLASSMKITARSVYNSTGLQVFGFADIKVYGSTKEGTLFIHTCFRETKFINLLVKCQLLKGIGTSLTIRNIIFQVVHGVTKLLFLRMEELA